MNRIHKCLLQPAIVIALVVQAFPVAAQVSDSTQQRQGASEIDIQMLSSPSEDDRPMAFFRLRDKVSDPRIAAGMRKLLRLESEVVRNDLLMWELHRQSPSRSIEGSYYADIAEVLAEIATPADIKPLLVFIGNSQYAANKIATMGAVIIDTLLESYSDSTLSKVRMNAATVIKTMLLSSQKAEIPPQKMAIIRKLALRAAQNERHNVTRLVSVEILDEFKDEEVRHTLNQIIRTDEFSIPAKEGRRFPIKEAARKALGKYK